ncbi:hypothetical protein [Bathymodiolus platifrons methanotrophic gill symbiont]|uniref:hypothetical protein n=1 Tax=Bathymodiolus platifrons methanotrophic gill symbiont TaxID=113268 RepID=UPI001C8E2656|nr:hypothetical protein [Bathymodiolus platifrons methanotrophic gill symbiont]
MATSNGSTAIRDKILASLARYRALRIGKFPCAFWRLSSRPGLTARVYSLHHETIYQHILADKKAGSELYKHLRHQNKTLGAPCYLTKFRDSCRRNSFTYAANRRCSSRPASATD